jgi:hypothetical protein
LKENAIFREKDGIAKKLPVLRNYNSQLTFTLERESYTWYTVE